MKKKILRGFGYALCVVLLIMTILLIIQSALYGANKSVGLFGAKIYVVESDGVPTAPEGSAVAVSKCTASDLDKGNAVLYLKADLNDAPTLGYVESVDVRDGVSYLTVGYRDEPFEFPESKLVGRADYSSVFWGGLIRFTRTPLGVLVLAVLPCAALILFDVIRAAAAARPEPEVVPKIKNVDEERHVAEKISVDTEGKALYSKDRGLKTLPKNNGVLFNYAAKQKSAADVSQNLSKQPKPNVPPKERPIIPLTDHKPKPEPVSKNEVHPKPAEKSGKVFDIRIPVDIPADESIPPKNTEKAKPRVPEKTAELPVIPKSTNMDAFFAQPSTGRQLAPQIGRQRPRTPLREESEETPRTAHPKPEKTAGKRSSQILASKSLDDLFADDDDFPRSSRNNGDRSVDDILAGINSRK